MALNALNHATFNARLILGDNDEYWLTNAANAERLHKAGHEYAEY